MNARFFEPVSFLAASFKAAFIRSSNITDSHFRRCSIVNGNLFFCYPLITGTLFRGASLTLINTDGKQFWVLFYLLIQVRSIRFSILYQPPVIDITRYR